MTREEALQHFKEQLDIFGGEHAEAIKVAIEALSEETSTIQEKHQLSEETSTNTPTKSTNISTKSTNISTDASADRPRGEWHKNVEYSATGNERAMADQCSVCSGMVPWGMSDRFDFCPNCGADMRSE